MIVQNKFFSHQNEFQNFLLQKVKVDPRSLPYFSQKNKILLFYIDHIENRFCNIIKQEMLSLGGDAAVSKEVAYFQKGKSSVLLMGTEKQFQLFIKKAEVQPSIIQQIGQEITQYLGYLPEKPLEFWTKNKKYECTNKVYVMGVFNATPDSFYNGGKFNAYEKGINHIHELVKHQVDFIDIGGESSRPGAKKISAKQEIKRILPFIKYIKKNYKIPVSVDTYKHEVAHAVLQEGVAIINDISGLQFDKKMASLIAKNNAGVILMHIQGTPVNMQKKPFYHDLISEIKKYLQTSINIALQSGIKFNHIIIDPGIGFGKTVEHNYTILKRLEELKILQRPILIGLSMKSLIGKVLNNQPEERLTGTITLNTVSILNGANIIRVHHVKEHKEVAMILSSLKQ